MLVSRFSRPSLLLGLSIAVGVAVAENNAQGVPLPAPVVDGGVSIEHALATRRTIRRFSGTPLRLAELGQLLWAAQGTTHGAGYRTAPSAGALYPLELFVIAGNVDGLTPGIYRYRPARHDIIRHIPGDQRSSIAVAALQQDWIADAPAILVVTSVRARTSVKYGLRSDRYIAMEAGHAAQNIYLQCVGLGLATALVGGFEDDAVRNLLDLRREFTPLAIMPLGTERRD
jgi:SagB-type dehydrogenase family enzyme